ncbi:hypothetical protein BDN71DRAFT_1432984 [Pleurotus eryngii]|uniref:Uncharacterized protein n=1 Tax=Pleurotus eryngii TaxID=5323 RepID=A0A9P6D686_PLEER|nr:hypothetical protein BDN71DRAFT_1432984 [Pleurotus eryngii]
MTTSTQTNAQNNPPISKSRSKSKATRNLFHPSPNSTPSPNPASNSPAASALESEDTDDDFAPEMLLDLISVLDAVRLESSVTACINGGGLLSSEDDGDLDLVGPSTGPQSTSPMSALAVPSPSSTSTPTLPAQEAAAVPTLTPAHARPAHELNPLAWCADLENVARWARRGRRHCRGRDLWRSDADVEDLEGPPVFPMSRKLEELRITLRRLLSPTGEIGAYDVNVDSRVLLHNGRTRESTFTSYTPISQSLEACDSRGTFGTGHQQ